MWTAFLYLSPSKKDLGSIFDFDSPFYFLIRLNKSMMYTTLAMNKKITAHSFNILLNRIEFNILQAVLLLQIHRNERIQMCLPVS